MLTRYIRWRTSTPACTPARAAGHVMLQAAHSSWPKHQDLHNKSGPNWLPHGNTVTTGCWQGPSSPSNNACLLRLQHRTRAVLNGAYANTPLARHIAQDVAGQPQTTARCSQHLTTTGRTLGTENEPARGSVHRVCCLLQAYKGVLNLHYMYKRTRGQWLAATPE